MKTDTIILSIHPCHINKILSGEKLYEYRKQIPVDIRYIVVYATAPIKRIVALIEVDTVMHGSPEYIWHNTSVFSGISKEFFMSYFHKRQIAYAIKFKEIHKLPTYKSLSVLEGLVHAPQCYMYIKESISALCNKFELNNTKN